MARRFKDLDCIQAHVEVSRNILEDLQTLVEKNPNFPKDERVNLYEKNIKRTLRKMSKYEMDTIGKDIAVDPTSMCSKVHEWVQISNVPAVTGEKVDSPVEERDATIINEEAENEPSPKVESNPNPAPILKADDKPVDENDQHAAAAPKTVSPNKNAENAEIAGNAESSGPEKEQKDEKDEKQ